MASAPDDSRPGSRSRLDARMTAWLIEQRRIQREREQRMARLEGELAAIERIERASQRYADRLEEKLAEGRQREASLARALGYVESQRDQLLERLGLPPAPPRELGEPGERAILPAPRRERPDAPDAARRAGRPERV